MAAHRGLDNDVNYEEDLDRIDFNNYKGMFFDEEPGQKYQDEVTGAHFEYHDMCKRLQCMQKELQDLSQTIESNEVECLSSNSRGIIEIETKGVKGSKGKLNDPGKDQALQMLQELLLRNKSKEGRNISQALPQQGYGTTGVLRKENNRASYSEIRNFRHYSSQFGFKPHKDNPEAQTNGFNRVSTVYVQGAKRSHSTNKQRANVRHKNIIANGVMPLLKPVNISQERNAKKITLLDLYWYKILKL